MNYLNSKNRNPRDIGFYVLILIILISTIYLLTMQDSTSSVTVDYSEVRRLFEQEQVESFVLEDTTLTMTLREEYNGSTTAVHELFDVAIFYSDLGDLITEQFDSGILTEYNYDIGWQAPWWIQFLPYILLFGLFFLWYYMMNRAGGGGGEKAAMKFGRGQNKARHRRKEKGDICRCGRRR